MTASRRVHGVARVLRGVLAAHLAVGSAALAHAGAGHHGPHAVVILLALVISVPLCTALCSVRLSRARLAGAVVLSQMVLHGLFTLFPSSYGVAPGIADPHLHAVHSGGASDPAGSHAAHGAPEMLAAHPVPSAHDGPMLAAHLVAAVVTYLVLRRGELLLTLMADSVALRPFLMLLCASALTVVLPRRRPAHVTEPLWVLRLWPGAGPRTVRGPPLVMA